MTQLIWYFSVISCFFSTHSFDYKTANQLSHFMRCKWKGAGGCIQGRLMMMHIIEKFQQAIKPAMKHLHLYRISSLDACASVCA